MEDSPSNCHRLRSPLVARDSPSTVHQKVLENFSKQLTNGWITKTEFMEHVGDCNERYKDQMLGASMREGRLVGSSTGTAPSKRSKRSHDDADADAESSDDLSEKSKEIELYLSKTCRTFIYLKKKSDPDTTKIISLPNTFETRDGAQITMWARQTRTSRTYKCNLPECAKRDAFDMTTDRSQKINNHNKTHEHLKAVIKLVDPGPEWDVVQWSKAEYKALEQKHKLKRTIEEGKCTAQLLVYVMLFLTACFLRLDWF